MHFLEIISGYFFSDELTLLKARHHKIKGSTRLITISHHFTFEIVRCMRKLYGDCFFSRTTQEKNLD